MAAEGPLHVLLQGIVLVCAAYLGTVYVLFLGLIAVGAVESAVRARERRAERYDVLATSRFTIPVSVIVPAYNEEVVILPVVRSLLALEYPEFEVIVVNDGSRDRTLELLEREFRLIPREVFFRRVLACEPVRAIYRSAVDPRLTVVDKGNGGKADALNCGINLARYRYLCCVDGDTVYVRDALLKGMRLAVRDPATVLGVTSHVAISRRPEAAAAAEPGPARPDRSLLTSFQHLDYLRAFFNNRLAWSRWGFMLCAVGAFAIWRRDVVRDLGGFSRAFTCEDIELTFRVHERHLRERRPCQVLCLPDTVGTTEGPDRVSRLVSQRARWQRVITETVWHSPATGRWGSSASPTTSSGRSWRRSSRPSRSRRSRWHGVWACSGGARSACCSGSLRSNGILTTVAIRLQDAGCYEQLEKPSASRREIGGRESAL